MTKKAKSRRRTATTPSAALLTPDEARRRLRLSRGGMYAALAAGSIKHVRIGKKILIPLVVIEGIERGDIKAA